jgi:hypothetical protein
MFEKFQDYMYYLLAAPLKKIFKTNNQFYILFKVFGKLFDQTKQDIFRVRQESMIISANEIMLNEHGRDRDMQRLKGETVLDYRTRLLMKNLIAEKAGTLDGILIALVALGYEKSYIEPYYLHDPEKWAEFIVYLSSEKQSNITDLITINMEVMKVKPAGGLPSYGVGSDSFIEVEAEFNAYVFDYPICNVLVCGEES